MSEHAWPEPARASAADLPELVALLDRTIDHLHAQGIRQWARGNYPEQRLAGDIERGASWIWRRDGAIVAHGAIDQAQEAQWDAMPFRDRGGAHRCVHRFFIDPRQQGKGLGHAIMGWAEASGRAALWGSIRLDAFAGNPASNALYRRRGYQEVGRVQFGPIEAVVYELLLSPAGAPARP
jgi:GNAT superfamily N-acetyltransferase